ncbi:glycosyltransferase family 2 protein [bacterium]|nr:glycosyltransferase family 2 protein [bacterium]
MKKQSRQPGISLVIPVFNEVENVPILLFTLQNVLKRMKRTFEMIFVDDGSTDGTREELRRLAGLEKNMKVILLRKNFGQSAAMAAGFRASRGEWVVAMDGDLQNDPGDIPRLIARAEEGYDVVSGWRKNRQDKLLLRKIPSRLANRLICSVTDVQLHDTGCSLKVFHRHVIEHIRLYGELHRFIPALARIEGARITEVAVRHHARRYGQSKYNLTRTFRVLLDLATMNLFLKYLRNPLRFFGRLAAGVSGLALFVMMWMFLDSGVSAPLTSGGNVSITLLFLLWVMAFQFLTLGLMASLIVKTGTRKGRSLAHNQFKKDAS